MRHNRTIEKKKKNYKCVFTYITLTTRASIIKYKKYKIQSTMLQQDVEACGNYPTLPQWSPHFMCQPYAVGLRWDRRTEYSSSYENPIQCIMSG